jgi:hypothetical protein
MSEYDEREEEGEGQRPRWMMREAALAYEEESSREHLRVVPRTPEVTEGALPEKKRRGAKMKTSVYLESADVEHLAWLSRVEERPQAEIIRDAIRAYRPAAKERLFRLFDSGEGDGRSIIDIPEEELMRNFGADAFGDDLHR